MIAFLSDIYGNEPLRDVLLMTVIIGGLCAWLTGRAIARTWRSVWQVPLAMLLLACALQFIHFALFGGALLAWPAYLADLIVIIVIALIAWQRTRMLQMTRQYYWLYAPLGPLAWRRIATVDATPAPLADAEARQDGA